MEDVKHVGKKTCFVSCQETFEIQSGSLTFDSENVLYLLKCKICGEVSPTLGRRKPNFVIGLTIIKVNIERLERVIGKFLRNYFTLTIVSMAIVALKIGIL